MARDAFGLLRPLAVAEPFLAQWPGSDPKTRPVLPTRLPVLDWLGDLAAGAGAATRGMTEGVVAGADELRWRQTYTAADFGPYFLTRYGWSELIGTRGPIPSQTIASGFLLLGPEVNYPAHAHEAEELYMPLSGTASWQRDTDAWESNPPGTIIHHPPWAPHAVRTGAEPLLALYVWRGGDLAAKSTILRD